MLYFYIQLVTFYFLFYLKNPPAVFFVFVFWSWDEFKISSSPYGRLYRWAKIPGPPAGFLSLKTYCPFGFWMFSFPCGSYFRVQVCLATTNFVVRLSSYNPLYFSCDLWNLGSSLTSTLAHSTCNWSPRSLVMHPKFILRTLQFSFSKSTAVVLIEILIRLPTELCGRPFIGSGS